MAKRFEAYGWHTLTVGQNSVSDIDAAIKAAKRKQAAVMIVIKTDRMAVLPSRKGVRPRRTSRGENIKATKAARMEI